MPDKMGIGRERRLCYDIVIMVVLAIVTGKAETYFADFPAAEGRLFRLPHAAAG